MNYLTKMPSFLFTFIFLFLSILGVGIWNKYTYLTNLTSIQLVVTTIYFLFVIFIIKSEKHLWYILGLFYIILIFYLMYSGKKNNVVYENFTTTATPAKSTTTSATTTIPTTQTSSASIPKSIMPVTAPVTKESMTSNIITDIDEWSEQEKRELQGLLNKPAPAAPAESNLEKERTGVTFVSSGGMNGGDLTPAMAQRETYKLIDAVQQLQEVMSNLSPTLREGKKIIDMFDKLKKV
jgi:ABC-type iron transport system FetAB permease component